MSAKARLNQVATITYSCHNVSLAHRVQHLYTNLLTDSERLDRIRQQAELFNSCARPVVNDPGYEMRPINGNLCNNFYMDS